MDAYGTRLGRQLALQHLTVRDFALSVDLNVRYLEKVLSERLGRVSREIKERIAQQLGTDIELRYVRRLIDARVRGPVGTWICANPLCLGHHPANVRKKGGECAHCHECDLEWRVAAS